MKSHSPEGSEKILAGTTSAAVQLQAEIDEMRRRLAALEACTSAPANQTVGRKRHWRATPKKLALMIAGVMLAAATIAFGQGAIDALFVSKDGNVGIGTTTPANKLSVSGNADFSGNVGIGTTAASAKLDVAGSGWFRTDQGALPATAGKGVRVFYDEFAGKTGQIYSYDYATSDPRNLILQGPGGNVGIGTTTPANKLSVSGNSDFSGNVGIGTSTPRAKLDVAGTIISRGRYQRDADAETTYELSPRYHLSLTGPKYAGSTRQIPQQTIIDLCGDQDGCQFRLGMTRWDNDAETEAASITGLLYYASDGHWRTSMLLQVGKVPKNGEATGVDGNRITEHVANAWDTCYFTDAPYLNGTGMRDEDRSMYLLVWTGYTNANRTCELTLID